MFGPQLHLTELMPHQFVKVSSLQKMNNLLSIYIIQHITSYRRLTYILIILRYSKFNFYNIVNDKKCCE